MKGYKIFGPDWKCRGLQYQPGETAQSDPPELCVRGLHFCTRALDCLRYYPLDPENRYAEVLAVGAIVPNVSNKNSVNVENKNSVNVGILSDKFASDRLTIVREIPYEEFRALCTGERKEFYNNGALWTVQNYSNGMRSGERREWLRNGNPCLVENYRDGELDGDRCEWHRNGVRWVTETYRVGHLEGERREYHENGNLHTVEFYREDRLDGERRIWRENGDLQLVELFQTGILVKRTL